MSNLLQYQSEIQGRQYVPGIYIIESRCGKQYVGSAVSLRGRFMCHRQKLRDNEHDNSRLQNFYNKYGPLSLVFRVIEHCNREQLLEREQYYIDTLSPFFNIAKTAGATYGLKPWSNKSHSEETKAKIRASNKRAFAARPRKPKPIRLSKEENIERFRNINKSPEARQRSRNRALGNQYWLGKKHKPETISARLGSLNGRARKIICIETGMIFSHGKEAATFFDVGAPAICNSIRRGNKIAGKYSLAYAD